MKKTIKQFSNFLREVINLIIVFFKPFGIANDLLVVPKNVYTIGKKFFLLSLLLTLINLILAFFLKICNILIQQKFIILGIIFFLLYGSRQLLNTSLGLLQDSERIKLDEVIANEISSTANKIMSKVSNKMYKFDKKNNFYQLMSNEAILQCIKNFIH